MKLQGFSDCSLLYPMGTPTLSPQSSPATTSRRCRAIWGMPPPLLRSTFTVTSRNRCAGTARIAWRNSFKAFRRSGKNKGKIRVKTESGFLLSTFLAQKTRFIRRKQKKSEPFGSDFLVDDTRLEKQNGCVALYRPVPLSVDNTMFS